jgi:hypothetical protein
MLERVKSWFGSTLRAWWRLLGLRNGKWRDAATHSKRARLKESLPPDDRLSDLDFRPSPPINPARLKVDPIVVDSPAIIAMERRALRQIFEHLDLAMVPGWAFIALEQTRDPVMAFKRFSTWVGVDPLAARDREDTAMSRIAIAIELLSELAQLRDLLSEAGDSRICDALRDRRGSLSRLRDQMEHVTAAAKLHRIASRMEELPSCILASRLQAIVPSHSVESSPSRHTRTINGPAVRR